MTTGEKNAIHNRTLDRYAQAVDNRKAYCGRLAEHVNTFRDLVRLYDEGILSTSDKAGKTVFGQNDTFGIELPPHDTVVVAFVDYQKAHLEEARLKAEAINAGVNRSLVEAVTD